MYTSHPHASTFAKEIVFIRKKTCLHTSVRTDGLVHVLIRQATHVGLSGPLRKPSTDTAEAALRQTLRQVVVISKEGVITLDSQDPMKSSQICKGWCARRECDETTISTIKMEKKSLKTSAEGLM